ncbi:aminotransferase family protein [Marinobacterium stanieri]|uniref:Adenosylmethionine-8-amino-7-oxononanoate aminotransferase n=1 Tax=Marinobacterium stanieri TaxID=49186 RepID=A0A1N6NBZ2_9GAMM|nr:aspartate aminotransferase family protein [Marinobacterium stanieri]SIP89604.1 Adenosylmethionine-8-amino-7-oxononanoate aminotransferase [Marinobacterium stanieri]
MTGNALFYQASGQLPLVSHADGIYIWDVDGKRYIDACSGAITCNLGHNHPAVKAAMAEQLGRVAFSYRTQFESQVAIDLAEELVELTQGDLDKVFFVGSGSEAVESAMKLARQYFVSIGQSQRTHFVSLRPSYHGSTLGALSLTGYQPLEAPFTDITLGSIKVPSPDFYRYQENTLEEHVASVLAETDAAIAEVGGEHIIAIAIEPVGGASTGARMLNRQYMEGIREICDRHGCLLILDEVLSGMGRTGEWFAYQHWGVKPDLIALAKGMGAGYYPVAAMMARQELVDQVLETGGFMHGHTYAGNPLACATALAVVRATKEQELVANAARQGAYLREGLDKLAEKHACIGQVRGVGLLQGVEFVADRDSKTPYPAEDNIFNEITRLAKARGLLVYPRRTLDGVRGDHVLITPPLTVTREEIDEILRLFDQSLADLSGR